VAGEKYWLQLRYEWVPLCVASVEATEFCHAGVYCNSGLIFQKYKTNKLKSVKRKRDITYETQNRISDLRKKST